MMPEYTATRVAEYTAARIWGFNTLGGPVGSILKSAAVNHALWEMLQPYRIFEDTRTALDENYIGNKTLAKIVIAVNSNKTPSNIINQLFEDARQFDIKDKTHLSEEERKFVEHWMAQLSKTKDLKEAGNALNQLLYFDSETIYRNLEKQCSPGFEARNGDAHKDKELWELEIQLADAQLEKETADAYEFLASFDKELAEELTSRARIGVAVPIVPDELDTNPASSPSGMGSTKKSEGILDLFYTGIDSGSLPSTY